VPLFPRPPPCCSQEHGASNTAGDASSAVTSAASAATTTVAAALLVDRISAQQRTIDQAASIRAEREAKVFSAIKAAESSHKAAAMAYDFALKAFPVADPACIALKAALDTADSLKATLTSSCNAIIIDSASMFHGVRGTADEEIERLRRELAAVPK
jgi:hypothetical protein